MSMQANAKNTILMLYATNHPTYGKIHVQGYQNIIQNLVDEPNCMILHIPSLNTIGTLNFLPTMKCKHILSDMVTAFQPPVKSSRSISAKRGPLNDYEMIEYNEIYTVIIAHRASAIPYALNELAKTHPDRTPRISQNKINYYATHFTNYTLALCCFNNKETKNAAPILYWYTPFEYDTLRLPALDLHGDFNAIPHTNDLVKVDHWIFLSSDYMKNGVNVYYNDTLPRDYYFYLPNQIIGKKIQQTMQNGDFIIDHREVIYGRIDGLSRII